jgi:hypothetical protein
MFNIQDQGIVSARVGRIIIADLSIHSFPKKTLVHILLEYTFNNEKKKEDMND